MSIYNAISTKYRGTFSGEKHFCKKVYLKDKAK